MEVIGVALGIGVAVDICTRGVAVVDDLNVVATEVMVGALGVLVKVSMSGAGVKVGVGETWEVEHAATNRIVRGCKIKCVNDKSDTKRIQYRN